MKSAAKALALLSLAACLAAPFLFFWGRIDEPSYRTLLAAGSLAWFVFATYGLTRPTST
jgi:hypothetical protein